MTARRQANRLFVEEIDEVSSVDGPANQHGWIAIAKRAGEQPMTYTDAEGTPVELADLNPGETVFDEDGNAFIARTDDEIQDAIDAGDLDPDDVYPIDDDDSDVDDDDSDVDERADELVGAVSKLGGRGRTQVRGRGTPAVSGGQHSEVEAGRRRRVLGEPRRFGKSAGQRVLEELRKAATDEDRDRILAAALDIIDDANTRARNAETLVAKMAGRVESERFVELAKSYDGVPADPTELGGILHRISQPGVLSKRQLDTIDRILEAAGESGELYRESGYNGSTGSADVLGQVTALAHEAVGKSGGALTTEQAITEIFAANPEAYLEFESERYS